MPDFPITRTSPQTTIVDLQRLLNRLGTLLVEDGAFGGETVYALNIAQKSANLPLADSASAALWDWLTAQPEPAAVLPTEGLVFIARFEVGSRKSYDTNYCHPEWPGGESGITIGIGYDLRFATATFAADWQGLPDAVADALRPWLGKIGTQAGATALRDQMIPFETAWAVYMARTIPQYVATTRQAFPGYDKLPPLCQSALVSLVYNRGASLVGDSRTEMKKIHDLVESGTPADLAQVPDQFISMERLWPTVAGLRARRDAEAALWRKGLAG